MQRPAAGAAAAILQAILEFQAGGDLCCFDQLVWTLDDDEMAGGSAVIASTLLAVIEGRISFSDVDDLLGWYRELAEPRGGDAA
jgi:hypothetical protein